jgi:hypothetical protein
MRLAQRPVDLCATVKTTTLGLSFQDQAAGTTKP